MPKVVQPRKFDIGQTVLTGLTVLIAGIYLYTREVPAPPDAAWSGETMGTTYTIKLAHAKISQKALAELQMEVNAYFDRANQAMSTYLPDSAITRFNSSQSVDPVSMPEALVEVTRMALAVSRDTDGAFDPTVGPFIELWKKGSAEGDPEPTPAEIAATHRRVGWQRIEILSPKMIVKHYPSLQLDLNAIAKGHAVDEVADILLAKGLDDFMVEIGGEVFAAGVNMGDEAWKIGVELPLPESAQGEVLAGVMRISGHAVATSGDYRNYVLGPDGQTYTHIFDPRKGRPAMHDLASVTVIAPKCGYADAVATALFVMGAEEGKAWVEARDNVDALFIVRNPDGSHTEIPTPGFTEKTAYQSYQTD